MYVTIEDRLAKLSRKVAARRRRERAAEAVKSSEVAEAKRALREAEKEKDRAQASLAVARRRVKTAREKLARLKSARR